MSTQDLAALQTAATDPGPDHERTERALTECMTTLELAPELYTVIGQNQGPEYTVDLQDGRCTCPDATYNLEPDEEACKHELRARYATGVLGRPDWIPEGDVDSLLGEHVHRRVDGVHTTMPEPTTQDNLELVDTGSGWLVFKQLTEDRDATTVITAKRLLGYMHVSDWSVIRDAVQTRGHGSGDALHLPEFETIAEARDAATEAAGGA